MSDKQGTVETNRIEIGGTVKWPPKFFEPQAEGQKTIAVFAIEWERPKSDGKKSVFHIKAFGDLADKLKNEKLDEGDSVFVVGSLNESKWKDKKTDEWKNRIEVWPLSVEFLERGDGGGDFAAAPAADDDDIPF